MIPFCFHYVSKHFALWIMCIMCKNLYDHEKDTRPPFHVKSYQIKSNQIKSLWYHCASTTKLK